MRVILLHNAVAPDAPPDEADVLTQVDAISDALRRSGHAPSPLPCTLDLELARAQLLAVHPRVVFNLVESLGGSDRLMHLAPSLLDAIHIPYTGSPAAAIFLTTHKLLAKERLRHAGIPTPEAFILGKTLAPLGCLGTPCPSGQAHNFGHAVSYILKTVWEHASFGLDDSAVVQPKDAADLEERLRERTALMGRECFAERYVDGREFNLSLLEGTEGPQVLPPAEIDFTGFPTDRPRIVGYKAKWEAESAEYVLTPRSFDFPATDSPLLDRLGAMARACWHAFGLKGYARVDFRVDPDGEPWVLEINANPCLSPDAGFAAALSRSGIPYDAAIGRILDAACTMAGAAPGQPLPGTSPHVPTS